MADAQRHTKRPLPSDMVLTADPLALDVLVHRGQDVTLVATSGGIAVRAPGKALTERAAQLRLQVQNRSALKLVQGVVDRAGVVRIATPRQCALKSAVR